MKKLFITILASLFMVTAANAQVFVRRPSDNDVKSSTYDFRFSATSFEVQWVGDGRNVRGAFNIGSGVLANSLVSNLPPIIKDFRLVPFVTVDAGSSGVAPRATVALIAPQWNFSPNVGVQFGAALRGVDPKNDWRPVNGVDPYVKFSVYYK